MKPSEDGTTIVVTGSFNPAILQPQWVARFGLKQAADAPQFDVELAAQLVDHVPAVPRFRYLGLDLTLSTRKLVFFLRFADAAQEGDRVCKAVGGMLAELRHTPVTGFGLNFGFDLSQQNAKFLGLFGSATACLAALPDGRALVAQRASSQVTFEDYLLTSEASRTEGTASLTLNFHRGCTNAIDAAHEISAEGRYARALELGLSVAKALSGEDIDQ